MIPIRPVPCRVVASLALAVIAALAACKADDPAATPDAASADAGDPADGATDGAPADGDRACQAQATDYQPRVMRSATDPFPPCVSDQDPDTYVVIDASVSTIARVAAFEEIAAMLFTAAAPPAQAFIDARILYLQSNGLESRVSRREDEHYPPATTSGGAPAACNTLAPAEQAAHADRCVGPVVLAPLLGDAFAAGATAGAARERRLAAARVEAGLLRFLYLSVFKEAVTCAAAPQDCDSSWAYYGGGDQRAGGKGLARYARGLEPSTHDRAFDGVLAVRCWRDLDDPADGGDDATYAPLRTAALAQLDRAALRAVALIVRARTVALASAGGDDAAVHWELVRHLGPTLLREAAVRAPTQAVALATELARTDPAAVDAAAIVAILDAVFPCP